MSTAAEGWSKSSTTYAQKLVEVTSQGGQALLRLVDAVQPFKETSKVLDNGAGSGALTSLLREISSGMAITAADVAPGMLAQLEKRSLPNVEVVVVDAAKDYVVQGLKADNYSHVLSTFMLQFISPAQDAINESFRVLAPGGIIGSAIWSETAIMEPWNIACKNLDPEFEPNETLFAAALKTTADMEAAYAIAGFEDPKSSETELSLNFDSAEDFANYWLTAGNPPFLAAMSTWKGKPEDVRDELVKVTRDQFNNGKIPMVAACSVAKKPVRG